MRPGRSHIRILTTILMLSSLSAARAGTILDNVPDSQYLALAAQSQFSAVGCLTWNNGYLASGTYLGNGWVLTAGHVTSGNDYAGGGITNASFAINGQVYSASQFIPNPGWTATSGDLSKGYDIGLVRLGQDIPGLAPAALYTGSSELNSTLTIVGYGFTGTGLTGYATDAIGTKRAGQNVVDRVGGQSNPTNDWLYGYSPNTMFTDFDSPNRRESMWGSRTPLAMEYCAAPGDSGGGDFIQEGGQWYVAGVTSFLVAGTDGTVNASYGDMAAFTRVSPFVDWIDQMMATPSLPGDANHDGKVTFADYIILELNFGKTNALWTDGDFNGDGRVDFKDYIILEGHFGQIAPEPATFAFLLSGLTASLRRRP